MLGYELTEFDVVVHMISLRVEIDWKACFTQFYYINSNYVIEKYNHNSSTILFYIVQKSKKSFKLEYAYFSSILMTSQLDLFFFILSFTGMFLLEVIIFPVLSNTTTEYFIHK